MHRRRITSLVVAVTASITVLGCLPGDDPWEPRVIASPELVELLDEPASSIATGGNHSCAQTAPDRIECWGAILYQVAPVVRTVSVVPSPVAVTGTVVTLDAGEELTCVLADNHTVECWGVGTRGALGIKGEASALRPVVVQDLAGRVEALSVGYRHACVRLDDGSVACWGDNGVGQVGLDATVEGSDETGPVIVLDAAEQIAAGYGHSCASLGELVECWGDNRKGQLAAAGERTIHASGQTSASGPVLELAVGNGFTCARLAGGVECWGEGLGHAGEPELRSIDFGDVPVEPSRITAGASHACALGSAGQPWCWGDDDYGQVGDGEGHGFVASPVEIEGGPYVDIRAGLAHTCALTEAGEVLCWGANQVRAAGQI